MTTAEIPTSVGDRTDDQLSRDLAELYIRAQKAAAELADIHDRMAVLEERIRQHQQRR